MIKYLHEVYFYLNFIVFVAVFGIWAKSTEQLPVLLKAYKKGGTAPKQKFEDLRDAFTAINSALIKKEGLNWWDNCVWNTNATIISNATVIYSTLMD